MRLHRCRHLTTAHQAQCPNISYEETMQTGHIDTLAPSSGDAPRIAELWHTCGVKGRSPYCDGARQCPRAAGWLKLHAAPSSRPRRPCPLVCYAVVLAARSLAQTWTQSDPSAPRPTVLRGCGPLQSDPL
eukprot:scaffold285311_cov31-Tisochrysis_lutea.AAC.1